MAKPIELGLVLEGEDARRFQRYLDHPTDTDDDRELIREAAILALIRSWRRSPPCGALNQT